MHQRQSTLPKEAADNVADPIIYLLEDLNLPPSCVFVCVCYLLLLGDMAMERYPLGVHNFPASGSGLFFFFASELHIRIAWMKIVIVSKNLKIFF